MTIGDDDQIVLEAHPTLKGFWAAFHLWRDGKKVIFRIGDKVKSIRFNVPGGGALTIERIYEEKDQPCVDLRAGAILFKADPWEMRDLHPLEQLAAEAE